MRDPEALGKCLVFDAITAWRVFSLERYAPDAPAEAVLTADEMAVIEGVTEAERLRPPQERSQPLGPDIRSWVVLLARMRGWRPKKRRELPGNEVLWKAYQPLQIMVRYRQSLRGPRQVGGDCLAAGHPPLLRRRPPGVCNPLPGTRCRGPASFSAGLNARRVGNPRAQLAVFPLFPADPSSQPLRGT